MSMVFLNKELITLIICSHFRYVLTYQIVTWWGIQVTLGLQLWLARLLMKQSRYDGFEFSPTFSLDICVMTVFGTDLV